MAYIYDIREDTLLMLEKIKKYAEQHPDLFKKTLEIGVGNARISQEIEKYSSNHTGTDINPDAIKKLNKKYFISDLFEKIKGKYNLIVFNPPYLPLPKSKISEKSEKNALYGGKKGYETIFRFLEELPGHLENKGVCLLLFSDLSKPLKILEKISQECMDYKLESKKSYMMEMLYIYNIKKREERIKLEKKGYKNIKFLAKGKHGEIFTAKKNSEKLSIKILNKKTKASSAITNESSKLKFVNTLDIGPLFYESSDNFLSYKYVEGLLWKDYYKKFDIKDIKKVLLELIRQCYKMDIAGFQKEEMTRPGKHIIIKNQKPVMIDFERGIFKKNPSNVTQFLQHIASSDFTEELKKKGIKINKKYIIDIAKNYKSDKNIKPIENYINKNLI
ncbi:MAG: HemK2/MTQ2 family protein methyltransferase [Candidatus Muiribacteriota bacterium]